MSWSQESRQNFTDGHLIEMQMSSISRAIRYTLMDGGKIIVPDVTTGLHSMAMTTLIIKMHLMTISFYSRSYCFSFGNDDAILVSDVTNN